MGTWEGVSTTGADSASSSELPTSREGLAEVVLTAVPIRTWARSVFGLVAEGRVRRGAADIVRLVLAALLTAGLTAYASRTGTLEATFYDLLTQLPGLGRGLFRTFTLALIALGIGLLVLAVVLRRFRLAGTILLAGSLAGGVAYGITQAFDITAERQAAGFTMGGTVPEFPVVELAAACALVLSAAPYLTRPARRLTLTLVPLGCFGEIYLLNGFPSDVLASLVIAWGASSAAHLAFGSPAGTPSVRNVEASLRAMGVDASDVELAPVQTWGTARYVARDPLGRELAVEVIGRDATDAQLLATVGRALWYKDARSSLAFSRLQRLEHEAYLTFLAARTGVPVPDVVAAGTAGARQEAVLVTRPPAGTPFRDLPAAPRPEPIASGVEGAEGFEDVADEPDVLGDVEAAASRLLTATTEAVLSDAALDDAWRTVGRLHEARMAHGDLGLGSLRLLPGDRIGLTDFSQAIAGADEQRRHLDRLALLASTAHIVGADRAVRGAERALGTEGIAALLPLLQPAALSAACRRRPPESKKLLGAVKAAAVAQTDAEPPELTELRRVSPGQVFMAAATILGIYLLAGELASVDDLWATLTSAEPAWVLAVILCAQVPQFMSAVTVLGAVSAPLPYGRVVALQYANGFTGLIGGTVANTALIIRFFQRQGLGPGVAVSSGMLWGVAGFIVQVVLVVTCLFIARPDVADIQMGTSSDSSTPWLLYGAIVVAVVGVAFAVPRVRRTVFDKVKPQVDEIRHNLRAVAAEPRKAAQLFGGALGSQVFFALSLDSAVHAYGGTVSFAAVVLTNSFASMVGGLAPIPGGMGVTEAGMIAGLTAAGVPQETAVAATLLHRTFTYYLPPVWGWFALKWLRDRDDI